MAGGYHRELIDDCSAAPLIQACKELGKKFVYCFDDVLRLEIMGRYVIHDLMDICGKVRKNAMIAPKRPICSVRFIGLFLQIIGAYS